MKRRSIIRKIIVLLLSGLFLYGCGGNSKNRGENTRGEEVKARPEALENDKKILPLIKEVVNANGLFSEKRSGMKLHPSHSGYARSLQELCTQNSGLPKDLSVQTGKDASVCGYLWRYIVLKGHKDDSGISVVDSYMLFIWPDKIKQTGTRVFVAGNRGIYSREARQPDTYAYPFAGWPEKTALNKPEEWKRED